MNEDQIKSQIGSAIPTTEDHPLHILNNQVDPEVKVNKVVAGQKAIRTYESDMADVLKYKNSSIISIAVEENKRKIEQEPILKEKEIIDSQSGKKLLFIIISLILIISGLGGGYYLYLQSPLAVVSVIQQKKTTSIINPDVQKIISIPSLEKDRLIQFLLNEFKNNKASTGKITEFIPVQLTKESSTEKLTGSKFIDSMKFEITDTLKRSLLDKWMIGTYSQYSESGQIFPFIVFTTDFFQNSFAGMLKWESTMPDELAILFNYKDIANTQIATNPTATSSRISSFYNIKGSFTDKIISNRDIREFTNKDGTVLLLYTFLDKDTLLITTSEDVIPALIKRIEKQTYLR